MSTRSIRYKTANKIVQKNYILFYQLDELAKTYNCEPFVFGPELAIDNIPRPVCDNCGKISSSNLSPQMDLPPRPVFVGSPP